MEMMEMDGAHYMALQVAHGCSQDEIRRAYHRAARALHPDKQNGGAAGENGAVEAEFQRVQRAYEVLRDPQTRAAYDRAAAQRELVRRRDVENVRVADEVRVADMRREELPADEEDGGEEAAEAEVVYSHACRCGDAYEVAQSELDDGVDVVPCNGCSLHIRVLTA